jgi:uncharacterized protein (TIGR03435 family)
MRPRRRCSRSAPGDAYAANGGRFRATNQPLITYLRFAYRLGPGDLPDLPRWVYDTRFDIDAQTSGEPTKDQMRALMRALLKDRFNLVVHTERRTQAVFDLELASPGRTGPQLRAHRREECASAIEPELTTVSPSQRPLRAPSIFQLPRLPCGSVGFATIGQPGSERVRIVGNGEPMDRVAEVLKSSMTGIDRHIRDRTGLTGTFDLSLEWSMTSDTAAPQTLQDDMPPRFLEALKTQLGLKLRSTRGAVDVLVVDKIERPTEN